MKKSVAFSILIFIACAVVVLIQTGKPETMSVMDGGEPVSGEENSEQTNDIVYTVVIRRIAPSRPNDSFAWEIESKQGQLAQSLNALGLYSGNPDRLNDQLGEDSTVMCYPENDLDLKKICDKLNLDYDSISSKEEITITYTQDNISY